MARVAVAGSGTGRCKALMRSLRRLFNDLLLGVPAGLQGEACNGVLMHAMHRRGLRRLLPLLRGAWQGSGLAMAV